MVGKGCGMGGQSPAAWSKATTRTHLKFWVNGKKYEVSDVSPRETTLEFLRRQGLTGTKLGCGEGGCGACTVVVSKAVDQTLEHYSVNACLTPICALDSCSITTVEGLGTTKSLHPVQQRLAEFHGSQCGFCTPGIVMALYALVENGESDLEHKFDGNLCRCTGYRPILDAAKTLDKKSKANCAGCCDVEDCASASGCASRCASDCGAKASCSNQKVKNAPELKSSSRPAVDNFPQELLDANTADLLMIESETCTWFRPTSLTMLVALKKEYGDAARLVCGNTEVGIETKFKHRRYEVLVGLQQIPELNSITESETSVTVGGAVTLSKLDDFVASREDVGCLAVHQMLSWFASRQIRNVASLAGNIATASPISDMNPMLVALDATIVVASAEGKREVSIRQFFKSYRTVALSEDEIIMAIRFPKMTENEFISPFKQARRREDDISIVTSGMRVKLAEQGPGKWTVEGFWIGFGGMAPTTIAAYKTEEFFVGKEWSREVLAEAVSVLASETTLDQKVPGGMPEFRSTLCASFLHKFFVQVSLAIGCEVDEREKSAADTFLNVERPETSGYQRWPEGTHNTPLEPSFDDKPTERAPVGESLMHKSAYAQVTGEAKYADDYLPKDTDDVMHAALVLTTVARGTIVSIDASEALAVDGVIGYFSADDVPGTNKIGAVLKDEEVFVTKNVTSVGQPVGIVVAKTLNTALDASRLVKVEYDTTSVGEPVLSIEDAIAAESFFGPAHDIVTGKPFDEAVAELGDDVVVVSGEANMGGQEHFYLECNSSICYPLEDGGMKIVSSTQNPMKTQHFLAAVLGVPASRVNCSVKRMGGGFGGKETRSVFIASALAVAADKLKVPVKITLDRDVDMSITGTRHAFKGKYKAACQKSTGLLVAVDINLYANAGYSLDLSQAVVDRALFHCENSYYIPNLKALGYCCKTNTPSNTAFRGFGGPQGMFFCETYMEHLASALEMPPHEFREKNLYCKGERALTPYHQVVEDFVDLPKIWGQCVEESDFVNRRQEVATFNANNKYKKRGIAIVPTKFGISFTTKFLNQGGALVHVYTDGSILVSHGGTEMGQGLHTKVQQAVARAFGLSTLDKVHIEETATDKVPNSSPSAASLSTDLYVMASLDAARQIIERLAPIRAQLPPDASFETVVNKAYFSRVNLSAQGFYIVPGDRCGYDFSVPVEEGQSNTVRGNPFNYYTSGVAVSEVELDTLTGDIDLRRVDVLMDIGRSINPSIDCGQIEGAFAQGYGLFTMEEIVIGDPKQHAWVKPGHFFTKGPGAYKIPASNDAPLDMRIILADNTNPFACHSSRAIGEPPLFLGASAFFAVQQATVAARQESGGTKDFYMPDSPFTSERARMACTDDYARLFLNGNEKFKAKGTF